MGFSKVGLEALIEYEKYFGYILQYNYICHENQKHLFKYFFNQLIMSMKV